MSQAYANDLAAKIPPSRRDIVVQYGFATKHAKQFLNTFLHQKRHAPHVPELDYISYEGVYANVATHPQFPGFVVKLSKRSDMAYCWYMEQIILKYQDNPHVPQVGGYVRLRDGSFMVLMERLEMSCTNPKRPRISIFELTNYIKGTYFAATIPATVAMPEAMTLRIENSLPAPMLEIAKLLRANPEYFDIDLKNENIMWRDGQTLVVTDPYVDETRR